MIPKAIGHRVIVKPDVAETETASGLALPDDRDHIPTSGTVVSVGQGSLLAYRAYQQGIRDALNVLHESVVDYPGDQALQIAVENLARLRGQSPPELEVSVGDRVVFPAECGLDMELDNMAYIVLLQDDVCVVLDERQEAA